MKERNYCTAQGFAAAHGLQGFATAYGLHGFDAAQGLHGFAAAQGLHGFAAAFGLQGLQGEPDAIQVSEMTPVVTPAYTVPATPSPAATTMAVVLNSLFFILRSSWSAMNEW